MEIVVTPQKKTRTSSSFILDTTAKVATPSNQQKKVKHPRTPQGQMNNGLWKSKHILSTVLTPPAKRFHKIRNPFETALADRLHLPIIESPSLFQRKGTPQLSSTHFEWTIDEVSQLKPTHVEPHETQFHDSPDPDYEDKVQSAISSYFKEHQIVPSPIDCPLRNQRIILNEVNANTPISNKPGRRIRDFGTQTQLSFPSVLPPALEEALRPYMNTEACSLNDSDHSRRLKRCPTWPTDEVSHNEMIDTSLCRKLFDIHNIIVMDSPPVKATVTGTTDPTIKTAQRQLNVSPMMFLQRTAVIVGKLSDSVDNKSSFGSLSPISATDGLSISSPSPMKEGDHDREGVLNSSYKRKARLSEFMSEIGEVEMLSPIHPPSRSTKERYRSPLNMTANNTMASHTTAKMSLGRDSNIIGELMEVNGQEFTPDRSSSPMLMQYNTKELTTESFNIRVSRLAMNSSSQRKEATDSNTATAMRSSTIQDKNAITTSNVEIFIQGNDTVDMDLIDDEDGEIATSQLSTHSSNCSSSNSETPRSGYRRSANRKNLSQSFSTNWADLDLEFESDEKEANRIPLNECPITVSNIIPTTTTTLVNSTHLTIDGRSNVFYRTDSGFNEMTSTSTSSVYED